MLWGLDQPLYVQYVSYLAALAQGEFGRSLADGRDALSIVLDRAGATLLLGGVVIAIRVHVFDPDNVMDQGGETRDQIAAVLRDLQEWADRLTPQAIGFPTEILVDAPPALKPVIVGGLERNAPPGHPRDDVGRTGIVLL